MFELSFQNNECVLIFTNVHSKKDINHLSSELKLTVERVRNSLLKDKLFSIFDLTMEDTSNLLNLLGEIEKFSSWNDFDYRETDEIVNSLNCMLLNHKIYDIDGNEISVPQQD